MGSLLGKLEGTVDGIEGAENRQQRRGPVAVEAETAVM